MPIPNYPTQITFPVKWGEMDALGHVNNTVYFRYFEDVRILLIERLGYESATAKDEIVPMLAYIDCQFIQPLFYPDKVTIGCWISKVGNSSMHVEQEVYSQQQQAVVAKGKAVMVLINTRTQTKISVPDTVRKHIKTLQHYQQQ